MTGQYDDIIHLPHHRSKRRSHMSLQDRAAQFSPFAALTGFDSAIEETGRLTDSRVELEEYGRSILDRKLAFLLDHIQDQPQVSVTYFCPDTRKSGGTYREVSGRVRKIDLYRQIITMTDGREISIEEIVEIGLEK